MSKPTRMQTFEAVCIGAHGAYHPYSVDRPTIEMLANAVFFQMKYCSMRVMFDVCMPLDALIVNFFLSAPAPKEFREIGFEFDFNSTLETFEVTLFYAEKSMLQESKDNLCEEIWNKLKRGGNYD